MRLGIVAYIVPFVFVFHPALLFKGAFIDIASAIASAVIGVILLGIGVTGYLFRPLAWAKRVIMIIAGVALIPSATAPLWLATNVTGLVLGGALVAWEWKFRSKPVPLPQPSMTKS
jgi:TRAP-type uncharacterized transport system fused permease subunit